MNKKMVIFGDGQTAEIAAFMFQYDAGSPVVCRHPYPVAFTVDRPYLRKPTLMNMPVIPVDEIVERYPPAEYDAFVAVTFSQVNRLRAEKMALMKSLGYQLASYVSSQATVFPGLQIGENCLILEDNTIQPFVTIGDGTYLWSGNHIGHHTRIGNHVFVASQAVISGAVTIEDRCFIGVNATIRDNVTIGEGCIIGAGALITKSCEPDGVYGAPPTARRAVAASQLRAI